MDISNMRPKQMSFTNYYIFSAEMFETFILFWMTEASVKIYENVFNKTICHENDPKSLKLT